MNIIAKIKTAFAGAKKKFFVGSTYALGSDAPSTTTRDYLASFSASALVHSATSKIAEKIAGIELELYKLTSQTSKELEQHELLDLLAKPNQMMSGSDLFEITAVYLALMGNCYWYKARDGRGKIIELWLMRPDLVQVMPVEGGGVSYRFTNATGKQLIFAQQDVVHFKDPNPLSDYYGMGAIQPVMEVIRADVYAKKWNTRFFYNSARPDAIISTEQEMEASERDEIHEKWMEKYGGYSNAYNVAVLSHGLDYKQISVNQKDMDFANQRIANREDVFMALRFPKSMAGLIEESNRSTAETALFVFLSETIVPKMKKIVAKLNHQLVIDFGFDLHLSFVDPTPRNQESLDLHYEKTVGKTITVNEARIEQGYDPIEGGDSLYMPLNLIEIGKVSRKKDYNNVHAEKMRKMYRLGIRGNKVLKMKEDLVENIQKRATEKIVAKMVEKIEQKKTVEAEIEAPIVDEKAQERKMLMYKAFDAQITKWEKGFKELLGTLLVAQAKRAVKALDALDENKLGSADLMLLEKEKEVIIFVKGATGIFTEIVKEAGDIALAQVGEKSIKKDFDPADPVTAEWIKKKVMKFADEVNETTLTRLKNNLAEGVLAGESIPELKQRVVEVFKNRIASSSETIARTEVLSSNNAGTVFGYKESGVVEQKEWLATFDGKTRDAHAEMSGVAVGVDEMFNVDGEDLEYPGDPSGSPENIINCRCTVVPVVGV